MFVWQNQILATVYRISRTNCSRYNGGHGNTRIAFRFIESISCLLAFVSSQALNLAEEKGSTMEFLRQGYTKGTWWEVNTEEEESSVWRS